MTKDKSIFIKNIYYMLSYAFQTLNQENYDDVATESFDEMYDLLAAILAKGIGIQLKQEFMILQVQKCILLIH